MSVGAGVGTPISTVTLSNGAAVSIDALPLEAFRQVFDFNRWHFWQIADAYKPNDPAYKPRIAIETACDTLVRERAYRGGVNGRANMREALADASVMLTEYLGFGVPRAFVTETVKAGVGSDGRTRFRTSLGHVGRIGALVETDLGAGTVVYEDRDGDGLTESAKIVTTLLPAGVRADDVILRFEDADLAFDSSPLIWPLTLTQSGGQTTIRLPAWVLIKPARYSGEYSIPDTGGNQTNAALDPGVTANFAATVRIVLRSVDAAIGATVNATPADCCGCGSCLACGCCKPDANGTWPIRLEDARLGIMSIGASSCVDSVTVRYESAWPGDPRAMREMIARYAATNMQQSCNDCATAQSSKEFYRWTVDRAYYGDQQGFKQVSGLDNPLGTREGAIWAWTQIKRHRINSGMRLS